MEFKDLRVLFYFCRVFCSEDHYEQFKMKYGKYFKETCY